MVRYRSSFWSRNTKIDKPHGAALLTSSSVVCHDDTRSSTKQTGSIFCTITEIHLYFSPDRGRGISFEHTLRMGQTFLVDMMSTGGCTPMNTLMGHQARGENETVAVGLRRI